MRAKAGRRGERRRLGAAAVVLLVLHFGVLFWILALWSLPGLSLTEISRLWDEPGYAGFSLFTASTFIVLLLLYLLIAEGVLARRAGNNLVVAFCLVAALPLAAMGSVLVDLAHFPRYFLILDRIDEPFSSRGVFLGRVLEADDSGPTRYLQVVLEDGTKVTVAAVPRDPGPGESRHVAVGRFAGSYTHTLCHRLDSYIPAGWLGLAGERKLDALE